MSLVIALLGALRASLRTRTDLALENLALRQQLVLLRRRSKRPQFGRLDRLFWLWLSHQWAGWRGALHVVRPQTVIRWHRQGFRAFWTSELRSGGERHGAPRATQPTGGRATARRDGRGARIAVASSGGEAGRVVAAAPGSRGRGQCGF